MPKSKKLRRFKRLKVSISSMVLVVAIVLVSLQTFQLYSMKKVLADEGLSALGQGGASQATGQNSVIPDQVGGCFRG